MPYTDEMFGDGSDPYPPRDDDLCGCGGLAHNGGACPKHRDQRRLTPAEQLKQRIQQRRDREAAELAADIARHTARRDGEARVILDLAKKTMEEKLETMYHHPDSVDDRVADHLVLMCQSEGFICNKKHPSDSYVEIEIGIP